MSDDQEPCAFCGEPEPRFDRRDGIVFGKLLKVRRIDVFAPVCPRCDVAVLRRISIIPGDESLYIMKDYSKQNRIDYMDMFLSEEEAKVNWKLLMRHLFHRDIRVSK